MRRFLLGLLTGVVIAVLGAALLLVSVTRSPEAGPPVAPSRTATTSPEAAPTDLARGETWLEEVTFTGSRLLAADDAGLVDLFASGRGLRVNGERLVAQSLVVTATVPWAVLATQVGSDTRLYAAGGGRAGVERTLELLGRQVPVKATGTVRAEDGLLVIEPQTIDLAGPGWLDAAASYLARELITIRRPVQGLPAGLSLTTASAVDDGIRATLRGSQVTLLTR